MAIDGGRTNKETKHAHTKKVVANLFSVNTVEVDLSQSVSTQASDTIFNYSDTLAVES